MAKNTLTLDTSSFDKLLAQLYRIEHEASKEYISELLTKYAARVNTDTHIALSFAYLPAHGKYSRGQTAQAIADNVPPTWEGGVCSVPVGFDFNRDGAGGYLISGTPKMNPDPMLQKIYRQKAYMTGIEKEMFEELSAHLQESWEKQ